MKNKNISTIYEKLIRYGYDTSLENCKGGYPDKDDCTWYHSNWMLLRYLDVVSNPYWHEKFYSDAIDSVVFDDTEKFLVAGTADFSMPLFCHEAGIKKLDICDICNTPLLICNKAAKLLNCDWSTYVQDICKKGACRYNVILNDAFLSRFLDKSVPLKGIVSRLETGGYYITTLKTGEWNKGGEVSDLIRKRFIQKVTNRYELERKILPDINIEEVAKTYVDRMASYPVINEDEVYNLFRDVGLNILQLEKGDVVGEFEASKYFRIISRKI